VGEYRLVEPLGAGGMGQVWRVLHLPTGAERALKTIPASDPELLLRFQREAQALAQLDHPHVTRVHTQGRAGDWLYLVMDLAPGGDLAQRLARGPLEPEAARSLLRVLGRAVAYVHAQGLLHRDLKPSNVVFDADERPLLVDFGLVRRVSGSSLTQTGTILGTPSHMAPEQAEGARTVDARADVYGLGAILFHALTGRAPFVGPTPMAVLSKVMGELPPDVRELAPRVPADLADLCAWALAKDPQDRPQTAETFVDALAPQSVRARAPVGWALFGLASAALLAGLTWRASERAPGQLHATRPPTVPTSPSQPGAAPLPVEVEHPLDRKLGALELPSLSLLESSPKAAVATMGEALLERKSSLALTSTVGWLWDEGHYEQSLALAYQVAKHGVEEDEGSIRGWELIGTRLAVDMNYQRAGWSPREWAAEGRDVVLECYRRGTEANAANAWLSKARLHLEGAPTLDLGPDPGEAVRCLRKVPSARRTNYSPVRDAAYLLAEIALAGPPPGGPDCDEALDAVKEVMRRATDGSKEHAKASRLAARLQERIDAGD